MPARNLIQPLEGHGQRGSAFAEFAIVLPVILLTFFTGFEFSRTLERWQFVTTFSREAANNIFRDCAADRNDPNDAVPSRLQLCAQLRFNEILAETTAIEPNLTLIVSIYAFDPATSRVEQRLVFGATPARRTRFTLLDFNDPSSTHGRALRENEILVVGEAYAPSGTFGLLSFGQSLTGEVYASTIM